MKGNKKKTTISKATNRVDHINDQMDSNPHYPFNLQSEWLPDPNSSAMKSFLIEVQSAPKEDYAPSIQELDDLISQNPFLTYLIDNACRANSNLIASQLKEAADDQVTLPIISSKEALLNGFNKIMTMPPQYFDNALVGLPFSALVVGIDPTLSWSYFIWFTLI